jgi:predicted GNAT family N-acyltransferase
MADGAGSAEVSITEAVTPEERRAVFRLRREIYIEELQFLFSETELTDELDDDAIVLQAHSGDELVGTGRLVAGARQEFGADQYELYDINRFLDVVPRREIAAFERLMVRPAFRGSPAALLLILGLVERALAVGASVFLLDSQPHHLLLYEGFGMRPYLPPVSGPAGAAFCLCALMHDDEYLRATLGPPSADFVAERVTPPPPGRLEALRACFPARPPVRSGVTDGDAYLAEIMQALRNLDHALASDLPSGTLERLLDSSFVADFPPGIPLILPGMLQQTLYLVLAGRVEVFDSDRRIGESGPGSLTGEVAFLLSEPRMNEVRAGPEGVQMLGFSVSALRDTLAESQAVTAVLYRALAVDLAEKLRERQSLA